MPRDTVASQALAQLPPVRAGLLGPRPTAPPRDHVIARFVNPDALDQSLAQLGLEIQHTTVGPNLDASIALLQAGGVHPEDTYLTARETIDSISRGEGRLAEALRGGQRITAGSDLFAGLARATLRGRVPRLVVLALDDGGQARVFNPMRPEEGRGVDASRVPGNAALLVERGGRVQAVVNRSGEPLAALLGRLRSFGPSGPTGLSRT
jgi:hypothetical protein